MRLRPHRVLLDGDLRDHKSELGCLTVGVSDQSLVSSLHLDIKDRAELLEVVLEVVLAETVDVFLRVIKSPPSNLYLIEICRLTFIDLVTLPLRQDLVPIELVWDLVGLVVEHGCVGALALVEPDKAIGA